MSAPLRLDLLRASGLSPELITRKCYFVYPQLYHYVVGRVPREIEFSPRLPHEQELAFGSLIYPPEGLVGDPFDYRQFPLDDAAANSVWETLCRSIYRLRKDHGHAYRLLWDLRNPKFSTRSRAEINMIHFLGDRYLYNTGVPTLVDRALRET